MNTVRIKDALYIISFQPKRSRVKGHCDYLFTRFSQLLMFVRKPRTSNTVAMNERSHTVKVTIARCYKVKESPSIFIYTFTNSMHAGFLVLDAMQSCPLHRPDAFWRKHTRPQEVATLQKDLVKMTTSPWLLQFHGSLNSLVV